jgi:hypothetical protein
MYVPHTIIYVSRTSMCLHTTVRPRTTMYVSLYYYTCVLVLLHYMSAYSCSPHTPIVCVLALP